MSRNELLRFLRFHRYAVEASVSSAARAASARAAVIGFAVTDGLEIVFDTLETSRKAQNLAVNPAVALVIGGLCAGEERTVQLEGVADRPMGTELDRLRRLYYGVFADGPQRLGWPGLVYFRVRPVWIRFTDFTKSPAEVSEFSRADLSAAI